MFQIGRGIPRIWKAGEPNCIIIDMQLPDNNCDGLRWHIGRDMDPAAIFTTDQPDVPIAVLAMKAGAVQVLTKPVDPSVLIEAVSEAIVQDRRRRLRRAELVELQQRFSLLTPREREVVPLSWASQSEGRVGDSSAMWLECCPR